MRHNHQGFQNYKDLITQILEEVEDIQDYEYNLSTVITMITKVYDNFDEDFPQGLAYKNPENITIQWEKESRIIYLNDDWKEGIKLIFWDIEKEKTYNLPIKGCPSIALRDVIYRFIYDMEIISD